MWKERLARQRAELALEAGAGGSRRSTLSGVGDDEALERLAAEAAAADTLAGELAKARVRGAWGGLAAPVGREKEAGGPEG